MKNRAIIPLAIGLVVGLIAVKLSIDVVKKAQAANGDGNMTRIVVAQQTIPMGVEVKPAMLSVSKTSKSLAPQGAFVAIDDLAGRVVNTQIPKGVPVIEEMLAAPGTPAGMASLVPNGYRAVAVKVDEFSSVGGFLKPGCRVDVAAMLSVRAPGRPAETISKIVLQNVMVGAVGQSLTGEGSSAASVSRSVTLLVKPDEVPVLHMAATQGKIRLAMRHYEDAGAADVATATEDQLLPQEPVKDAGSKEDTLLSGLAKLFQAKQPTNTGAVTPQWAAAMNEKQATVIKPPFTVTVIQGGAAEAITFEDSRSMQRVNGRSRMPGVLAAASARNSAGPSPDRMGRPVIDPGVYDEPAFDEAPEPYQSPGE